MSQRAKKWLTFTLRWGVAVVGVWWVISQITWRDRVTVLRANNVPQQVRIQDGQRLDAPTYRLLDGETVSRADLVSEPDQKKLTLGSKDGPTAALLAMRLTPDLKRVQQYLVADPAGGPNRWVTPAQVFDPRLKVPHPIVEVGIGRMIRAAASGNKPWLLILDVLIFPVTFAVTSFRWHRLLTALDIHLTLGRTFVLNMVGAFYNTFMPGSTGGDVLKAYYASKQTPHRTRAVMSVFVDRVIGLIALVILGGTVAAVQWATGGPDDPAAHACGKIALVSALIVFGTIVGAFVFYHPALRRMSGLAWLITRLPKQKQVGNAVKTMEIYGRHKWLVLQAVLATFPVHVTVVLSAMLAGKAFGLQISTLYYFVAVPVIVLVGSIPISPQGAGVMEYFAILLLGRQGATVSEAFALTMSIRMVQILWNLTGGIFVFRGGYHQPTEAEQRDLGDPDPPAAQAA
jgi:uncharacterized protein (TIRG00374 family)